MRCVLLTFIKNQEASRLLSSLGLKSVKKNRYIS